MQGALQTGETTDHKNGHRYYRFSIIKTMAAFVVMESRPIKGGWVGSFLRPTLCKGHGDKKDILRVGGWVFGICIGNPDGEAIAERQPTTM